MHAILRGPLSQKIKMTGMVRSRTSRVPAPKIPWSSAFARHRSFLLPPKRPPPIHVLVITPIPSPASCPPPLIRLLLRRVDSILALGFLLLIILVSIIESLPLHVITTSRPDLTVQRRTYRSPALREWAQYWCMLFLFSSHQPRLR